MPRRTTTHLNYTALARFRRELRRFLTFSERAAREFGVDPQQHQLLLALRGLPTPTKPPTIGNIAEWLVIQHHSAVELVDRAGARGLVRRVEDPEDRRRVLVEITSLGEALLADLSRLHRAELEASAPALLDALRDVLAESLATEQPAR